MPLRASALIVSLFICPVATGQNAVPKGRGHGKPAKSVQRRSPVNQQLQRQIERRSAGNARSLERRAERANQRMTRLGALQRQQERRESIRGLSPEQLRRHAKVHANLHAQLASGLSTGRPLRLDENDRQAVAEIFGDADLLNPRPRPVPGKSKSRSSSEQSGTEDLTDRRVRQPGWNSNPHARLANAIRVRRAQISELRDRAIETGDEGLLTKADRIEQKLDIFLHNQERLESNRTTAGERIAKRYPTETETRSADGIADAFDKVQLQDSVPVPTDTAIDESGIIPNVQD